MEDQLWLKKNFDNYKALQRSSFGLDSDEKTFPTYMGKRYALNVPPSSLLCDGLSMCRAPSCKDIGEKHSPEIKQRAMLFFEFLSGLNHAYHVIGKATQDHFRHIHEDIRQMTRDFTYADEQQDEAVKKEEKRKKQLAMLELAFGLIIALFSLLTAAGAFAALAIPAEAAVAAATGAAAAGSAAGWTRALSSMSGGSASASRIISLATPGSSLGKSIKSMNALSSGYLGSQGIVAQIAKIINHEKDLKGFDKTLEAFHSVLMRLDKNAVSEYQNAMQVLVTGGISRNRLDIVDLYKRDFFYGSNVWSRQWLAFQMEMKSYATCQASRLGRIM